MKVLILSEQPLTAALLGMLLELDAFEPAFPKPGERPEDAFARVRPLLVILLDGELEAAHSDLFYARAAKRHAPVIVFGGPGRDVDVEGLARERGVRWFRMPIDRARLARIVEVVTEDSTESRRGGERRHPEAFRDADGTLVYHDRVGRRWQVYDRRAGERRGGAGSPYRVFVGEQGEEWRVSLGDGEGANESPAHLESQMMRAELHHLPEG